MILKNMTASLHPHYTKVIGKTLKGLQHKVLARGLGERITLNFATREHQ